MRKGNMFKGTMVMVLAGAMAIGMAMTSFAAGWQKNDTGWWYGTNADNTAWHTNGWQWIDGNNDGVAECYYFNANGYMLAGTTTSDGYTVNADGAWVNNGVVQTKAVGQTQGVPADTYENTYNAQGLSNIAIEMVENTREENAKFGEVDVLVGGKINVLYANGFRVIYPNDALGQELIAPADNRKALFKYYDPSIIEGEDLVDYLCGLGVGFKRGYGECDTNGSRGCGVKFADGHYLCWNGGGAITLHKIQ